MGDVISLWKDVKMLITQTQKSPLNNLNLKLISQLSNHSSIAGPKEKGCIRMSTNSLTNHPTDKGFSIITALANMLEAPEMLSR